MEIKQQIYFKFSDIKFSNKILLEINDLILFQDGLLTYDWDRKIKNIEMLEEMLKII